MLSLQFPFVYTVDGCRVRERVTVDVDYLPCFRFAPSVFFGRFVFEFRCLSTKNQNQNYINVGNDHEQYFIIIVIEEILDWHGSFTANNVIDSLIDT